MEHSKFGYSAVNDFKQCPYKYNLTWNEHIEVLPDYDPKNALTVGTALHRAIETDFITAKEEYYSQFPVLHNDQITEMIKVEIMSDKVKELIESSGNKLFHETRIQDGEFIGTIDLLERTGLKVDSNGHWVEHYNMYDFKYSNNVDNYKDSAQLTIYKHFFEKTHPNCVIDRMFFIIVPKSTLKQEQNEEIVMYWKRLLEDLHSKQIQIIESKYDEHKLQQYFDTVQQIKQTSAYPKQENKFCYWCKYKDLCQKGDKTMILPSSERRQVGNPTKRKIWIYGATMSGKTTFLDSAPDPLNLNTDGNIQFVTMPYLAIKDEVTVEGRITKRKFAWEVFKDAISELEKKQNDFKTIIVDLVEDTREMCRLYKYDEMGIQHESDSGYGKGWDIIKTEYLSVIRRLFNLDYENIIVVSHETISEIKKKNGQTITKVAPNIQEAIANKIAGMVDIVARVVVEDDGTRTLNFKSNEYIFGGGRLKNIKTTQIPLDWDALMDVYVSTPEAKKSVKKDSEAPVEVVEEPKTRSRRTRTTEPEQVEEVIQEEKEAEPVAEEPAQEEAPKRRTRRTRS